MAESFRDLVARVEAEDSAHGRLGHKWHEVIARVEADDRELVVPHFSLADAWWIGTHLAERAMADHLPIAIDIMRGTQQVFHAAFEGSNALNDDWVGRKQRVVELFNEPSYLAWLRAAAKREDFYETTHLPPLEFGAAGGAVPVRMAGGVVAGIVAVSGLSQEDDHAIVVEAIRDFVAQA